MNAHTSYPWTVDGTTAAKNLDVIGEGGRVAMLDCDDIDADTLEANARLIAAAPDLLEALFLALPYVESVLDDPEQLACFKAGTVQRDVKAIRSAILKATGEAL